MDCDRPYQSLDLWSWMVVVDGFIDYFSINLIKANYVVGLELELRFELELGLGLGLGLGHRQRKVCSRVRVGVRVRVGIRVRAGLELRQSNVCSSLQGHKEIILNYVKV